MTKPQFKLVNIDGKNTTDERVVKCFCAENAAQKFATMLCKEIHGESDCTMTLTIEEIETKQKSSFKATRTKEEERTVKIGSISVPLKYNFIIDEIEA